MKKKVLNLYAGIGGNRKEWEDELYEVTAVEYDSKIAEIYKDNFLNDTVIIEDAHKYLLNHYKEYDMIWSSVPCQSHSSFRQNICVRFRGTKAIYADMRLYQEIIFLKYNFSGKWVVENVRPYYDYLIQPTTILQRHPFWSNFDIPVADFKKDILRSTNKISELEIHHGFDLSKYKLPNKRQILRNCVYSKLGKHVIDAAHLSCA